MIREKGRRTSFGPVPYGKLFLDGVRMHVEAEKRRKAEQRLARKAAR
jgi:hypothetical protein